MTTILFYLLHFKTLNVVFRRSLLRPPKSNLYEGLAEITPESVRAFATSEFKCYTSRKFEIAYQTCCVVKLCIFLREERNFIWGLYITCWFKRKGHFLHQWHRFTYQGNLVLEISISINSKFSLCFSLCSLMIYIRSAHSNAPLLMHAHTSEYSNLNVQNVNLVEECEKKNSHFIFLNELLRDPLIDTQLYKIINLYTSRKFY